MLRRPCCCARLPPPHVGLADVLLQGVHEVVDLPGTRRLPVCHAQHRNDGVADAHQHGGVGPHQLALLGLAQDRCLEALGLVAPLLWQALLELRPLGVLDGEHEGGLDLDEALESGDGCGKAGVTRQE